MEEDPKYLEATEYLLLLEERLRRAVRSSDDVVGAVNAGGIIVESFAENARVLGDCEEKGAKVLLGDAAGGLGQAFRQVGAAAQTLRAPAETQARRLADAFRAPLKRGLALVQAAKEAIDDRTDALLKLQAARARCEQKRARYEAAVGSGSNGVNGVAGAPPPVGPPRPLPRWDRPGCPACPASRRAPLAGRRSRPSRNSRRRLNPRRRRRTSRRADTTR